jgi:hypothetical protein
MHYYLSFLQCRVLYCGSLQKSTKWKKKKDTLSFFHKDAMFGEKAGWGSIMFTTWGEGSGGGVASRTSPIRAAARPSKDVASRCGACHGIVICRAFPRSYGRVTSCCCKKLFSSRICHETAPGMLLSTFSNCTHLSLSVRSVLNYNLESASLSASFFFCNFVVKPTGVWHAVLLID